MPTQFTIQGRIVFGHPGKPRPKKDVRTKQVILKDGQPVQQYVFGIAIEKNTFINQPIAPANMSVWQMMQNEAKAAFPNGIPQNFSYKFKDGDGVDSKGQPFANREGYAGHYVVTISTEGFAPPLYKQDGSGYRQITPEEIKCGDYVAVSVTIKYNGAVSPNTPGLYVNPNGIIHIGYGQEIVSSGQDPEEMFAGFQAQQFAGMTQTPVMSNAPMPSAMVAAPMGYPAPAAPMPAAPLPQPAHDFVRNAMGQPPAAPMPAAPMGYPAPAQPGYPPASIPGINPTGR